MSTKIKPRKNQRVCNNCQKWHVEKSLKCQHSGPFGGCEKFVNKYKLKKVNCELPLEERKNEGNHKN